MCAPSEKPTVSVREARDACAARARAILHVDMDAFYASIEQHDDPRLAGKPVIVGGTSGRGVVAAASYEVRRYGVRSAMPMRTALERCPHAICVRPRMARYQEVSRRIFAIFHEVTPLVQGLSLDEAFLDVTADPRPAAEIGSSVKRRIRETTGLTASVGVACNKLVAKIASDLDKPDGLTVVTADRVHEFLDSLSVRRLPGLGRKAGERVEALGLATLGELRRAPDAVLRPVFGRYAARVRERASGIDDRPVEPDREERSISAEDTFERDISDPRALAVELERLADRACDRVRARQLAAGCIAVKIRRHDFATFTRQHAVAPPTQDRRTVARIASELLRHWLSEHPGAKLRLLGVALRGLCPATQLGLFEQARPSADAAVDAVRLRFGRHALRWGIEIK
jgi:DNA polymerase IV